MARRPIQIISNISKINANFLSLNGFQFKSFIYIFYSKKGCILWQLSTKNKYKSSEFNDKPSSKQSWNAGLLVK